jgi:excisionase family DNA binding protein
MFTTSEVAEKLNLSEKTIRNLIESGELEAHKFGRVFRISEEQFNNFIEKSKTNINDEKGEI